ncbi:MAG TPA: sucrase ferredoxin [Ornithinimicrobium sp.]|nr:sucrase ferredoxin [Ornithinimicrobium sp.]
MSAPSSESSSETLADLDLSGARCSDAARERQDPMLGTAPPQRRFLLVEQEGGWAFEGFPALSLQEDVKAEVIRRAEAAGARIMLIRRPGRHSSSVCLSRAWCVVDPGAPAGRRVTWGTWAYPAELLAAVDRVEELHAAEQEAPTARVAAPFSAPGPLDEERLILVCTHGRKDVCCALRGRPVALDLARRWPEQVWECTHTGGDRFAANVVLLPDGATYGGLDTPTASDVVRAHVDGRPQTAHLRGVTGHPRPVQAAVVAVHEQLGPLPWGSVVVEGSTTVEPAGEDVEAHRVTLRLPDGRRVQVDVGEHRRPAAQLTCRAGIPKVSQVPVPGTVRVLDPPPAG